ncbi:hypothetical protein E2P65_02310 [Candidatus Bathyarchaeota archaeon]|nr:hypothetical protein E2P65_02310 [Candidatus Bathyarchaeota archaeon]
MVFQPAFGIVAVSDIAVPTIDGEREVIIGEGGMTLISDIFTLQGPLGRELATTGFWTGLPEQYESEHSQFDVWKDDRWQALPFEETLRENFTGYFTWVPEELLPSGETVKVRASYMGIDWVFQAGSVFGLTFPLYPALEYNISLASLHVEFPPKAIYASMSPVFNFTMYTEDGVQMVDYEAEDIEPYSTESVTLAYTPTPWDEYLLECLSLKHHVTIRSDTLRVEDSYSLKNRGTYIFEYHVILPLGATDIEARDRVGPLTVEVEELPENATYVSVNVAPRSTWMYQDLWGPTISYSIDRDDYFAKAEGSNTAVYSVPGFPFYIHDLSAIFTLPRGGEYISALPAPISTEKVNSRTEVVFDLGSLIPYEEPELSLGYTVSPLAAYIQPLSVLLVVTVVVGVVYVNRRRKPRVVEKKVVAERPKIASYLANYNERIDLLNEHIQILKGESEEEQQVQRLAEINRRLEQLERSVKQTGSVLEEEEPELIDHLRQIRRAEEEVSRVNEDLRNLDVRLRARRISRRDHQRRRESRLNRQREAIKRIEKALSDIQAKV